MPRYTVTIAGGADGDRTVVYDGSSLAVAQRAIITARAAAEIARGTLLIVLRKDGKIVSLITVAEGQVRRMSATATLEAAK